jgi:predicted secreted hydrolase
MRRLITILVVIGVAAAALFYALRPQDHPDEFVAAVVNTEPVVQGFTRATGPAQLSFPADFGPHPDYQTEWWYYTGNLETADGRHFGYELTFFRNALLPASLTTARSSDWATNQIYMAHFAITDVDGQSFQAFERFERGAAGLAGAQAEPYQVWLDDWQVEQTGPDTYHLLAANEAVSLNLQLHDEKGPILEGDQGYSQKGPERGNASYYYSETRLDTQGEVTVGSETFSVSGLSWKDHEYSTAVLSARQVGWDWFSIQLDDGFELMLYQIRQADGSIDPFSSGTLIAPDGSTQSLNRADFEISSSASWHSPHSGADYPMGWQIRIPSAGIELKLEAYLQDQELNLTFIYWEGAVQISGSHNGQPVHGVGYTELTGYARPFNGKF